VADQADDAFRVSVLTYGQLEESAAFAERSGLSLAQLRSLRAHPYAKPTDPARLVLLRGERRAAHMGMIPGRMRLGADEHRLFWGSANWEFDGEARNRAGAGLLLLIAMKEAGTFAGCGPSDFSRPILARARFDFLRMPRRALLLRSRAFLARRLQLPRAASALATLADPLIRGLGSLRRQRWNRAGNFRLEPVARFDTVVDEIDLQMRGQCWFPRDHRELNWALAHPWLGPEEAQHRAFLLRSGGQPCGYVLARTRRFEGLHLGSLLRGGVRKDVPGAARALVAGLVDALDDLRVDIADVCTSNRLLLSAAAELGMLERRHLDIACKFGPEAGAALRRLGATLADFDADMGEGDVIFA
jgi:hypothetical protein